LKALDRSGSLCRGCVPNKFCWEVLGTIVMHWFRD
jgi:hypothetical protein